MSRATVVRYRFLPKTIIMIEARHFATETQTTRVVIEQVTPELDGGRHAVKRVRGDTVEIQAALFKDGHDGIAARVVYRGPGENEPWRDAPMRYEFNPDRWHGSFEVDRLGTWEYTIEAWPDRYGSWASDLRKRVEANQDIAPELLEGAQLLEQVSRQHPAPRAERLRAAARILRDPAIAVGERVTAALKPEVLSDAEGPVDESERTRYPRVLRVIVERSLACFAAWYELFPRSQSAQPGRHGTFADVEERLADLAAQGFDIVYLPPIHPIGRTHRKGKNNSAEPEPDDVGSPWAIGAPEGGHTAVHPELGTLDDFDHLVRTANEYGIEIALDYALQCSPDHPWVEQHPEWFFIRPDGSLRYAENPPKKYEDIYPLNFWCEGREALWQACLDIFLFWIDHGVRVFRVDNPHTKPMAFWEWVLAEVRRYYPDTVFLSESFTRPNRMNYLAKIGFTQTYTYFTWKNTAAELREFLQDLTRPERLEFYRPNFFTNTPDILHEYLQRGGRPAFRIRLVLAATLSPSYGIYSGYELCENVAVRPGSEEYLDSEKYEIRQRPWNAPVSIKRDIIRINSIRIDNPALQQFGNLTLLRTESEDVFAYWKTAPGNDIVTIVNLDPHRWHETMVHLPLEKLGLDAAAPYQVEDLLTGERFTWKGPSNYVRLDPAERVAHVFRVVRP